MKYILLCIAVTLTGCNASSSVNTCDTGLIDRLFSEHGNPDNVFIHQFKTVDVIIYDWKTAKHQAAVLTGDDSCQLSHFHGIDYSG